MCPFEKRHFLTWIDLNPGFGRNYDTFLKKSTNGTFKALQMKVFGPKKFQIPCIFEWCEANFLTLIMLHKLTQSL